MTTIDSQNELLGHFEGPPGELRVPSSDPAIPDLPVMLHYNHDQFRDRLSVLAESTGGYEGTLSAAADSAIDFPAFTEDPVDLDPDMLIVDTRSQIHEARRRIGNTGSRSVVIEAGHVYAYEDLEDPTLARSLTLQAQAAHLLRRGLLEDGLKVEQVMFFDDYNVDPATGELRQFVTADDVRDFLAARGFDPASVMNEGNMVDLARVTLDFMDRHQGLVKAITGDKDQPAATAKEVESYNLAYRGYELYSPPQDKVSCAMLDTALSIVKLHHLGDIVVNILPRKGATQDMGYKSQQKKMRTILGMHLGARMLPIVNIFTEDGAEVSLSAGAHHDFRKQR